MKTEHIHIRCSHAAKEYTQRRLKVIGAGYTLSGILDRLSSGKGLVSAEDAEVIRRIKVLLVRLRHIKRHTTKEIADQLRRFWSERYEVMDMLGQEIARLECGTQPMYLYDDPCFNQFGGHAYTLLQYVYDEVPEETPMSISAGLYRKWMTPGFQDIFLKDPCPITMSCIYSIRREYTDRPSFDISSGPGSQLRDFAENGLVRDMSYSNYVRMQLDFLHDIPRMTDMEYEMRLSSLEEEVGLLEQYVAHPFGDAAVSIQGYANCIDDIVEHITHKQPERG